VSLATIEAALVQQVGAPLGLDATAAALAVVRVANDRMAGAIRMVSLARGHDPRDFALFAFGGAGPLHANAVAELMGSFPVIVPPSPGLLCALGDLVADFRNEFARTLIRVTSEATPEEILAILDELEGRARGWMAAEDIAPDRQGVTFAADMRYHGQGYEIPVPLDLDEVRAGNLSELDERFNALHEQLYGFRMPDTAAEIVNLRAVATGDLPKPELPEAELEGEEASGAVVEQGEILFAGERRATPIYDRGALRPGNRFAGPAIVTEFDSTTVVLPGYVAEVDRYSNILITPEDAR
jgi:N-methylhydantoinase A